MTATDKQEVSYLAPFLTLVFLFFVIGFLTTANGQFQAPLQSAFLRGAGELKNTLVTLITFSWFLAYPLTGGIGSRWIARKGYKGTLVRALAVMCAGLLLFFLSSLYTVRYPDSAVELASATVPVGFFIFLLGSFVTGASVTILQVVINPYLTVCSVKGTQPVQRLAIGGTANSIGTTAAPYFVTGVVFGGAALESVDVGSLMVPFLALTAVVLVMTALLGRMSMPDIEGTRAEGDEKLERSVWSFRHLTLGVATIFFYVGAEVCIGNNINLYAIESGYGNAALMATLYWGGMLLGRLAASFLSRIPPRTQLTFNTVCAIALVTAAIVAGNPWLLVAVGLFHSTMWGAIFTLSVDGLGKYTSAASGVFMIGVVGGAILPLLQGAVADTAGWRYTWLIVLAAEIAMLLYAQIGSRTQKGNH